MLSCSKGLLLPEGSPKLNRNEIFIGTWMRNGTRDPRSMAKSSFLTFLENDVSTIILDASSVEEWAPPKEEY